MNVGNQVPIDFHSMKKKEIKNTMKVDGDQNLFGYQDFSEYLCLYLTKERNSYRSGAT